MPSDSSKPPRPAGAESSDPLASSISIERMPEFTQSMELVVRYQNGEKEALDELLRRYQDRIRRIVRIKLGSRLRENLESMDIVQEANVVAMRKIDELELRNSASILNWLSQIVLNKIRDANDYHRAGIRDMGRNVPMDAPVSPSHEAGPRRVPPTDQPLPEEVVWREELREILDDSMTKLPPTYREVILLRDYYAGDWEYVAAQLDKPTVHAAQEHWRRAWIKLRRIVRPRLNGIV